MKLFLPHCAFDLRSLLLALLASTTALSQNLPTASQTATLPRVLSSITVSASTDGISTTYSATGEQMLSAAGNFGDAERYLQTLPGVTAQSDSSTGMIVRGGNPTENLFLVNGFEVPNLNHIATGSSTGGFASMIDASVIDSILFRSSDFSASEADRLSSVIAINTLHPGAKRAEAEVGLLGAGVLWQQPITTRSTLLLSVHHGLANLFTNNIGLDGVPDYTDALATFNREPNSRNQFTALALGGEDSLNITPCWLDPAASSNIQMQYTGWRATSGVAWMHSYSERAASTLRFTDTEQSQRIGQQQQSAIPGMAGTASGAPGSCSDIPAAEQNWTITTTPVYSEGTRDSLRSVNYALHLEPRHGMTLSAGLDGRLNTRNYAITQPAGALSPYSTSTVRSDAVNMQRDLTTAEGSGFLEAALILHPRWTLNAGLRLQHFDLDGDTVLTPRISTAYRLSSVTLHASLAGYAQQPPAMMMLAWNQNQRLAPMRTTHAVVGADLLQNRWGRIGAEVYHKSYRDLPVSTEYAQVNFENLVDSLDQQFVWLPMTSSGRGNTYGAEITVAIPVGRRLELHASAGWASAKFSGLDGVARDGNYEIPITAMLSGSWQMTHSMLLTFRAQAASGRPYTPFNYSASAAQNRGIYDLTKLNALHGPTYSRLDFEVTRRVRLMHHATTLYGGLSNALDRQNLLGYYWSTQATAMGQSCSVSNCVVRVNQMPTQANFGARIAF
jgi:hypothetical protein